MISCRWLLLSFAILTSCSKTAAPIAEATVDGVHMKVWLAPMHPYLAEYRRWVEVAYAGKTEKKEVFADSGGYSWIVVRRRADNLELYDLGGVEFTIPVPSAASSGRQYLGRFDFDAQQKYVFISASIDNNDPSVPFDKEKP
jgi:hypothetical protein